MSDLHMRAGDGPQAERAGLEAASRWRVLHEAWTKNLVELRKDGIPFDLVVFTGDLGDWGHATDYPQAIAFLNQTCEALGVPLARLFLVPGNHDIDRKAQLPAWQWMRKQSVADPRAVSVWMAGGNAEKLRRYSARRDQILERQSAFWGAVATQLGRPELLPAGSPHQRLGYRQTVTLPGLTQPIHLIGLDTAWLAGDEHDAGALRLTEHQVSRLTTTADGAPLPGLRLALMHHRLADLADEPECRRQLADRVDLLLHGHQHKATADLLEGPDHQLLVLAAGCLYEGDEQHRYLNACQVIDLELDPDARPCSASVRFRGWSEQGLFWGDHALLYEAAPTGRLHLRRDARGWQFGASGGPPPKTAPAPHAVFVGREAELQRMAAVLGANRAGRVAIVALQGMAGIGKTYLAQEFHAHHAGWFGSYRHLAIDPSQPAAASSWIAALGKQAGIEVTRGSEWMVAEALRAQRALVHVDNVDSSGAADVVAELSRLLDGVAMVVTGRYTELGTDPESGWTPIVLPPLPPEHALELLRKELGAAEVVVSDADLRELVRQMAGLPLALHLAAGHLRHGRSVSRFLARLRDEGLALHPRDRADHVLRDRARGVLATSFAISRELMLAEAGARGEAWKAALAALGWAPLSGFGASLGAAITGLDEADGSFDGFIEAAMALSLIRRLRREERSTAAWAVHPLLGEFLRAGTPRTEIDARVGAWVKRRAGDQSSERGARWDALSEESAAIGEWIGVAGDAVVAALLPSAWSFAVSHGPVGPWLRVAKRLRSEGASRRVLWALCQLASRAGELDTAHQAATDMARSAQDAGDDRGRAIALGKIADVLAGRGEVEEALWIRREEELPVYERLGDVRARAITMGKIADVLAERGEVEEALRIWREEELPVYERLGDARARAVVLGKIADVLVGRGEVEEALRIRRAEQLPVFERLGDARARAVAMGRIADILVGRGEVEEALRIRREEELPVYERLGDVRSRAITMGKIADVLAGRGEVEEALRIRRKEQLPVYERLGDVRSRAITMGKIADVLAGRGEVEEALRIRREELLPVFERLGDVRERAVAMGKIADVLAGRGEVEEALRIRREEELPVYERLGDVRARAITMGKIADVLAERGEVEEALRIRWEEELPVYERLGDVRLRAFTMGKIADVLAGRGEVEEALRIRREEELPVYERLGDMRSRAITRGKIADVLAARGEVDLALATWRESLVTFERLGEPRLVDLARKRIATLEEALCVQRGRQ